MLRYFSLVPATSFFLASGLLIATPALTVTFDEVAQPAGIVAGYNGWMGGGVAIEDFDNDGDFDIAIAGGPGQPNRLFKNLGHIESSTVIADDHSRRNSLATQHQSQRACEVLAVPSTMIRDEVLNGIHIVFSKRARIERVFVEPLPGKVGF